MNDDTSLYQRLLENEAIAEKFHEVEKKVLSILHFKDFFGVLLAEIKKQFNLPFVWLSVIEHSDVHRLIESTSDMDEELRASINIIDRDAFFALIGPRATPVLVNRELAPYIRLLPAARRYLVQSMAIVPIILDGEWVGSLNQGDVNRNRYEPGMDTSLLERLGTKISLALSNVAAHERLRFLAFHDPLTGLLNRRVMESVLQREWNRSKRYRLSLSLLFLDVDDFKQVNDTHGHEVGDRLLKHLADNLLHQCRETDIVARFAGDEFVIVLPETDLDHATALVDRIRRHLEQTPLLGDGGAIAVSTSFGAASTADIDLDADNPSALLKLADKRLYMKKEARKRQDTTQSLS